MLLVPYVMFEGNAQEALDMYSEIFGATISPYLMKYSEAQGMEIPPGYEDKILHAQIDFSGNTLYLSDAFPGAKVTYNDSVSFNISPDSEEELESLFGAFVSAGATVIQPLEDQFWGAKFGSLNDKFGVHWSFNYSAPEA